MNNLAVRITVILVSAIFLFSCSSQKHSASSRNGLDTRLENSLSRAVEQYRSLLQSVPPEALPRTFEKGKLLTTGPSGWVSGFYPGTLIHLFKHSKDSALLKEALSRLQLLQSQQYNRNTHDLGFMMYCSFGSALNLLGDHSYDSILLNSAKSLSTRFNPVVGCIRSWNSRPGHYLVIIDNMMNLELLMHAFKETGDSAFYHIAVTHANTTIKNHFRNDYSSYHVLDYNEATGEVQEKRTAQGAADESAWSRGQVWGLYGFTMMYRETGLQNYLDQAVHIAEFILNHPNLPADKIPYWDFNAPGIPNTYRDASAGAIMASALLELSGYVSNPAKNKYRAVAAAVLESLSKPPYRTAGGEAGGFILQHGVGHLPGHSEIDVPLSYADYYYVEAAMRYLGEMKNEKCN